MTKDLTNSSVDRQNILNNPYALAEIQKVVHVSSIVFEGKMIFFKEQVADFFEVTSRTIENYLAQYEAELTQNGYTVLRGKQLKELKLLLKENHDTEIDFVDMKIPQVGIFDFRSLLNLSMLMVESERARLLRQAVLDIVIDTINAKTGGGTKYINQRDEDFIQSWFLEENYRKRFTDALRDYVDMGNLSAEINLPKSAIHQQAAPYHLTYLFPRQIKFLTHTPIFM